LFLKIEALTNFNALRRENRKDQALGADPGFGVHVFTFSVGFDKAALPSTIGLVMQITPPWRTLKTICGYTLPPPIQRASQSHAPKQNLRLLADVLTAYSVFTR
jgi:hypothetical protein